MSNLRTALNQLASSFASSVLDAIRGASLQEILAESGNSHAGPRHASAYSAPAYPGAGPVRRGPGRPRGSTNAASQANGSHTNAGHAMGNAGAPSSARGRRRGRLARRSAGDISQIVDSIVQLLERRGDGLRAEQIRAELNLEAKELPRPIAEALASRRIQKQGQKRATTYFARGRGGAAAKAPAGKSAGKTAKKAGRPAGAGKTAAKKPGRPAGSKNKPKTAGRRGRPAKSDSAVSGGASSGEASE